MQKIKSLFSTGLLIIILTAVFSYFGSLLASNLVIYDLLLNKIYKPIPAQTTIFEYDKSISYAQMQHYIVSILDAKPKAVYLFLPDDEASEPWNKLAKTDNIQTSKVLGYTFSANGHAHIIETSSWLPTGEFVLPPKTSSGISRTVPFTYQLGEQTYNSFLTQSAHPNQGEDAFINFIDLPKYIPYINIARLNSEDVTRSFIAQKYIILTPHSSLSFISINTPFNYQGLGPNEIQYQAMSWEAVTRGALMSPNSLFHSVILGLLIGLVLQILLARSHIRWSKFLIMGVTVALLPGVSYWYLKNGIIPPTIEVLIAIFVSSTAFFHDQRVENKHLFSQLNHQILARLKDSILPKSFMETEDPWSKIAVMVQQQLKLERSIFLEKVHKDHRVREINAINCSINDIIEQRRDFHRDPYKAALSARTLTETNRPYFKEKKSKS